MVSKRGFPHKVEEKFMSRLPSPNPNLNLNLNPNSNANANANPDPNLNPHANLALGVIVLAARLLRASDGLTCERLVSEQR